MILGIKKAINKLMESTPWASNSLKKQHEESPRIFCDDIQGNNEYINMNLRQQGNYFAIFNIIGGTQTPENFYTLVNSTVRGFNAKIQECFGSEFIIVSWSFEQISTSQDSTSGILVGSFQLNISVIQKGVQ